MNQRFLFITLSCVGDAVMTTTVLEALHQYSPNATVDVVADKRSSELFSECPYRGDIIHKNKHAPFRGALELLSRLRPNYYDLIVDLRTDGLAYLFRAKRRLTKWHAKPYGPHSVQKFMGIIRKIHKDKPLPKTHLWLNEKHRVFAERSLVELPLGRLLALGPASGATEPQKTWEPERYAELANRFQDHFAAVVLLGGAGDKAVTAAVTENLSLPFIDTAGKTGLLEAAALLQKSSFFVGSDSGLGHVAAAMGVTTLSLFSNADPECYLPWGERSEWIRDSDKDVRNIKVDQVEKKLRELI